MLNIQKMIASAESCLGWPYVSPGTNDSNGIDCSGLFVKMYRDQGASIYHGSNTIYRKYCGEKGQLSKVSQLIPGMAVFKWNANTPAKYDDGLGDFQHIGFVCSVNPLKIIHASSAAGCVTTDIKLGKWKYWGKLTDVDYGTEPSPEPGPSPEPAPEPEKTLYVYSENGKPVNLRAKPYKTAALVDRIDVGTPVTLVKENDAGWSYICWGKKYGWMMDEFLKESANTTPTQEPDPVPDVDLPILKRKSRGDYVTLLQTKLIMLGYDVGDADGVFGVKTEMAVTEFQRNSGLLADGIVGPATWEKLDTAFEVNQFYTVTIKHLRMNDVDELIDRFGENVFHSLE